MNTLYNLVAPSQELSGTPVTAKARLPWVEELSPESVSWRNVSQQAGRWVAVGGDTLCVRALEARVSSSVCDFWNLQQCSQGLPCTSQKTLGLIHSFTVMCHLTVRPLTRQLHHHTSIVKWGVGPAQHPA